MRPRLSIILPCYNVSKYLLRCLDSIFACNLAHNDYEVICFDDASTDNTSNLLDEYAKQNFNMHVIHSKNNVGPGGGRNRACEIANGKYIWFVDADDMVVSENFPVLLRKAEDNYLDVLIFAYQEIDEQECPFEKKNHLENSEILNGREIGNQVFAGGLVNNMGYPVRFLLKREYLCNNKIFFPEKMTYGEDTVWMAKVVLFAERIQSFSTCAYLYWHHESSTCGQFNKVLPGKTIYERCIATASQLLDFTWLLRSKKGNGWSEYALEIEDYTKNMYINKLPLLLCRTSALQRSILYQQVKLNKDTADKVYTYMNSITRLILLPFIGSLCAHLLSFGYKLTHKRC